MLVLCASKLGEMAGPDTLQLAGDIAAVWPLQQQSCLNQIKKWSRAPESLTTVCAKHWTRRP